MICTLTVHSLVGLITSAKITLVVLLLLIAGHHWGAIATHRHDVSGAGSVYKAAKTLVLVAQLQDTAFALMGAAATMAFFS